MGVENKTEAVEDKAEEAVIGLKKFFESVPPGRWINAAKIAERRHSRGSGDYFPALLPQLELHCDTPECDGVRFFQPTDEIYLNPKQLTEHFVDYRCRNCGKKIKTYSLWVRLDEDEQNGSVYKLGEYPEFGPPTSPRLITLIRAEREYFVKGRRAENQALGIAAFAYYRRVVESQKNRILDEIIRVSQKLSASKEVLEELVKAKNETQFSKAVDSVKHALPQALLINGHNPLTLLHWALSEGLHAQTDEQCLEIATSIRVVIAELAERLSQALKDDAELNKALSRLIQKRPSNEGKVEDTKP